jgi:hypothetical protein
MFVTIECRMDTDLSVPLSTFIFGILGLFASAISIYAASFIASSAYAAVKKMPASRDIDNSLNSATYYGQSHVGSEQSLLHVGLAMKPCVYHAPILAGERKTRQDMHPMERFISETSSQANALFTRADNWKSSLDKGCTCEIGSGILSISADE